MSSRNATYCAFYVAEPFDPGALGAHGTKDFCYYNLLRSWKGNDSTFPFVDAHALTYSVRDNSDWEKTLKPRLRERIRSSKNVILFLSSGTQNSRAIREEVDYAINDQGLPIIVVYPEYDTKESLLDSGKLKQGVKNLWDKLPVLRDSLSIIPSLHVPMKKELIKSALSDTQFVLSSKNGTGVFIYK
ncbi:TIR domain-containing protein [Rhizobium leguminosarum]|uniref:TIR domain-containing protein n=1 Tax=Rhizobium leguminosarum TaxID=384 RepID=UPI001C985546|nr:TIR domain-containing protein [Rhizobium leguminosarum]MBY5751790.1 hypothetical protein [Rhizobium leguminosarum]